MVSCNRELYWLITCSSVFLWCFCNFLVLDFTKCLFGLLQNRADRNTREVLLKFLFVLSEDYNIYLLRWMNNDDVFLSLLGPCSEPEGFCWFDTEVFNPFHNHHINFCGAIHVNEPYRVRLYNVCCLWCKC